MCNSLLFFPTLTVLGLDKDNSASKACAAYFSGFSILSVRYFKYIFTFSASIMNLSTSTSTRVESHDVLSL